MSLYFQPPLIKPESLWMPPGQFPEVGKVFAFDLETKDPLLEERGPGSIRKDGYPVGAVIGQPWEGGTLKSWYFPYRHEGGGNLDRGMVLRYLMPILSDPTKLLVGANILYELEWMAFEGIEIKCQLYDVQIAEALLDEHRLKYGLDVLAPKYGTVKDESLLKEAGQAWGFGKNVKGNLWRLHSKYVGAYAESDGISPLVIREAQLPKIREEGLEQVLQIEHQLLPIIWKMRQKGVRVDLDRAENVYKRWKLKETSLYVDLRKMVNGISLDSVWANEQIEAGALKLGIPFPRTRNGGASFVAAWLEKQEHPYWQAINDIRSINKLNDTFIRQSILEYAINGRVHGQFHPTKRDEGGTVSGRLSSSNPNLQQCPNPEHSVDAWEVRAIYIPEEGELWGKLDYNQQEPRLAVHYGCLQNYRGSDSARAEYTDNPKADFYQILVKLAGITRSEAKKLYLGRTYGMGKDKLARSLGISVDEAVAIAEQMDGAVPFLKELYYECMRKANNRGFISTLLGRRAHFDDWEPARRAEEKDWKDNPERCRNDNGRFNWAPCAIWMAKKAWENENLKRAGTHKALNRLLQGGAADQMKVAMVECAKVGIIPLVQVHDELGLSLKNVEQGRQVGQIMEGAFKLQIPVYADLKYGRSWGEVK